MKIVPPTSNVKVVRLKPCNFNDILHIVKKLEYNLSIIPHLEGYYFIYCLQTCLSVGFAPPKLNAQIFVEDFECMWMIRDKESREYLTYNIFYNYIIFNDSHGYGVVEHPTNYMVHMHCGINIWRWSTTNIT